MNRTRRFQVIMRALTHSNPASCGRGWRCRLIFTAVPTARSLSTAGWLRVLSGEGRWIRIEPSEMLERGRVAFGETATITSHRSQNCSQAWNIKRWQRLKPQTAAEASHLRSNGESEVAAPILGTKLYGPPLRPELLPLRWMLLTGQHLLACLDKFGCA